MQRGEELLLRPYDVAARVRVSLDITTAAEQLSGQHMNYMSSKLIQRPSGRSLQSGHPCYCGRTPELDAPTETQYSEKPIIQFWEKMDIAATATASSITSAPKLAL